MIEDKFSIPDRQITVNNKKQIVKWNDEATNKNILAASNFLELEFSRKIAMKAGNKFHEKKSFIEFFKAKDLLRASNQKPAPKNSHEVIEKMEKIKSGIKLNPVLLLVYNEKLVICDGFHRCSACYYINESEEVAAVRIHLKDND